ncbi:tryptophanyl-tRNA synthetase [Candidatus Photodesmus katoptron]|uniref:tryptophan--tRNA ligase n=1 Tax=Candidatus Photodesmus anomalopis TaxID=28176 RepID=UPI0004D7BB79|nr:tryptophan--tRNA ligase [Candidatus Photodesmus katoptron]KEY90538.1 tryptophanyl-tRNA synthetase [Candidatus Photodesmus katoptron]
MKKSIVLSGIQPSGKLSIGNYLGALRQWIEMQDNYNCQYCIVDLHAISIRKNPKELNKNIFDTLAICLSSGIDPKKSSLFIQSHIPEHTQLSWLLNCYTQIGELKRMTQFKDKSQCYNNVNAGLFNYPVLMAADILLYGAHKVPVGNDQKQHLELARNIAIRFNNIYSQNNPIFTIPKAYTPKINGRVMSLQNSAKKMSKSDHNHKNIITLLDEPKTILKKINQAQTDLDKPPRIIYEADKKPGISNLMSLYSAATGKTFTEIETQYQNTELYSPFKTDVAEAIISMLEPIQIEYKRVRKDYSYLNSVMRDGAKKASILASKTLKKVYEAVGFIVPNFK